MTETVVVTGAGSPLGSAAVDHLLEHTDWRVVAVVSPRASRVPRGPRLCGLRHDLTRPLPAALRSELGRAWRVLHLAWDRSRREPQARRANLAMLDRLFDALDDPSKLRLVSSVAASPTALSVYARAKHAAEEHTMARGGSSLVCGLVVSGSPRSPYALLDRVVARTPVSLRMGGEVTRAYPVDLDVVLRRLRRGCEAELAPGSYRLFERSVSLDALLREIESRHPRRRVPVVVRPGVVSLALGTLAHSPLRSLTLGQKLLTFLYKDADRLEGLAALPDDGTGKRAGSQ